MSKLNIFNTEWIDMVFEGRNKAYGAYQLRSENPKTTTRALLIGAFLFAAAIAGPVVKNIISEQLAKGEEESKDKKGKNFIKHPYCFIKHEVIITINN